MSCVRKIGGCLFTAMVLLLALALGGAQAQVGAPLVSLEGPIQSILPNGIVVVGVTVIIPPGTPVVSPTADLTALSGGDAVTLLAGRRFPGRTPAGFLKGTAIITGRRQPNGNIRATDVFVEPAENVLIGAVTQSTCTTADCSGAGDVFSVLGAPLIPLKDPRMPAGPIMNQYGFASNLALRSVVGKLAAAEGYFAKGTFYFHTIEVTGASLANPSRREVSVQRAQCRGDVDGIQLDVLGAVHTPATGTVTITGTADGTVFGTVAAVSAGAGSPFGTYTFRLRNAPAFPTCPASVTAPFGAATAVLDVTIIP